MTAGAAVGVGANANVLVGGSNSSIALQPLSLQGQAGLNLAVGVAALGMGYSPKMSKPTPRCEMCGSPKAHQRLNYTKGDGSRKTERGEDGVWALTIDLDKL